MPDIRAAFPSTLFAHTPRPRLIQIIKEAAAGPLFSSKDAESFPGAVAFDQDRHLDVILEPYDIRNAQTTAVMMLTVVTHPKLWDDETFKARLLQIAHAVKAHIPDEAVGKIHTTDTDQDKVSITFVSKDCWVAA